jgi:hypothetical protein
VEEQDEEWVRVQELAKAPEVLLDRQPAPVPEQDREVMAAERVLLLPM